MEETKIERGDIFYADLGDNKISDSEQTGVRPTVVISNNKCNEFSPTVIIACLTSKQKRTDLPVHIPITKDKQNGLPMDSIVLLEQIKTIDRNKLYNKIGAICDEEMMKINKALCISLGLLG